MSFTYESHKAGQNQRKQLLLDAAQIFIGRGTPVMVTNPRSITPLDNEYLNNLEQVELALTNNPSCNVAVIVGQSHNLIAIKLEREGNYSQDPMELLAGYEEALGTLPPTMTIEYSSNEHYRLFAYPVDRKIQIAQLANEITILTNNLTGTNGLVLLEPSDLPGGTVSELSHSNRIASLPDGWIEYLCSRAEEELTSSDSPEQHAAEENLEYLPAIAVIKEHEPHDAPKDGYSDDDYADMDDDTLLLEIIGQLTLFRDDLSEPHFFCEGVPFSAPSKHVENWVRHRFMRIKRRMPCKRTVREIFDMLESEARFESPRRKLFNRVAKKDATIVYDLCDKRHLIISVNGWEIIDSSPLFRRYKHQQAQIEPTYGGNPWKIFEILAIPEEQQLLVLVYIICLFIPEIAHPVLAVCGDQGSAKSFVCNIINRLVDPTLTEKIIIPKNERDLIQTFRQKYVTVLDNISVIGQRVSDILCQVCTGGGVSFRQLYTNEGENIAQFRHAVILSNISLSIVNADLMDRSIILKLQRISDEDRITELELWKAFDENKATILGGIFDTLVKAMQIYPAVTLEKSPRLADFATWGYAVAEALGRSGDQFIKDYSRNVTNQNEGVIEKNVLCQAVLTLMVDKPSFDRYVADAHSELKLIAGEDAKDETFPKLPHNLRGHLDLLRSTLLEQGISYQFSERDKVGVKVAFTNSRKSDAPPTRETSDSSEKTATSDTSDTPTPDSNPLNNMGDVPGVPGVADLPTFDFGDEVYGA